MEHGLPADLQVTATDPFQEQARREPAVALVAVLLTLPLLALAVPAARILWTTWTGDYRFSHGPVVLVGTGFLLWQKRETLRKADGPLTSGWWLLGTGALATAGAHWLDLPTLLPAAWLGLLFGVLGTLRGASALRAAVPACGLLLFTLPWPTSALKEVTALAQTLTLHLTLLLAPLAGMPLERSGTLLTTAFDGGVGPYSVIVGAGCAGMKYLLALLSLGYFMAIVRPGPWPAGAAYVASTVPLALVANSLRILMILGFGAAYGPAAGEWAHQNLGLVAFVLPCLVLAVVTRPGGRKAGRPEGRKLGSRRKPVGEFQVPGFEWGRQSAIRGQGSAQDSELADNRPTPDRLNV